VAQIFQRVSNAAATIITTEALQGASFARFTYFLTGWKLVFLNGDRDIVLNCSDIEVPEVSHWWDSLSTMPIDIKSCHGPDDIIVAMLLTSNLCRHNVASVKIENEGDILLESENKAKLIIKGRCDPVDWTWDLLTETGDHLLKCEFGEVFAP